MAPSRRSPVSQTKTEVFVPAKSDPPMEQTKFTSSRESESPVSQLKSEVPVSLKSEPTSSQVLQTERDIVGPDGDTVVEERQTITVKHSPVVQDGRSWNELVHFFIPDSCTDLRKHLKHVGKNQTKLSQKQSAAS